jgi:hypothetical protein
MPPHGVRDAGPAEKSASQAAARPPIRGWLLVYIVVLAILLLHGAELTIASIIIYAHPSAAGLHTFIPLSSLLFYVATNTFLALYTVALFILMARRRRSAIIHNILYNVLSVAFLVAWHFAGEKSNIGTFVDAAPNLVGAAYVLLSRRVRKTFVAGSRPAL